MERVDDLKFLGVSVWRQLTWSSDTCPLVKKARHRLFFLRKAETGPAPSEPAAQPLQENRAERPDQLGSGVVRRLHGCKRNNQHHVVKAARRIMGAELPTPATVYAARLQKASSVCKD